MIKTNYLSTCEPTHKVIENKNKYIAHNTKERPVHDDYRTDSTI